MKKRLNVMNWLKKSSKIFSLTLVTALICCGICCAEIITGGVRKEYKQQEQRIIKIPEKTPVYSNGAILAYNMGVGEYKLANYDKAIDSFKSAVKQEPLFADAYFNLGILYDYFDNPSAAIIAFNRAYLINKKDYEALYYMVKCYVLLGDNIAAGFYLRKIDKESEFYSKAQQLLN